MFDKMVRHIVRTGKAHSWLKPFALLALLVLFGGAALAEWTVRQPARAWQAAGRIWTAFIQRLAVCRERIAARRGTSETRPFRPSHRPVARAAAVALSVCMVFTAMPQAAFAAEVQTGLCEHHSVHTPECGYQEAEPGHPCEHEHTADCYTDELICGLEETTTETASGSDAGHKHTQNCYKLDCPHERGEHDESCGYTEGKEGTPCGYVCTECGKPVDSGNSGNGIETVTLVAFDGLDEAVGRQSVPAGVPLEELVLPGTLSATAQTGDEEPEPVTVQGVIWEPDAPYEGAAGQTYTFTASAEGYVCAAGVDWPVITVTVEETAPDEVDALCAAIDALPTVEELYENAPGDADPEFDDWVTETKARLAEVSALWEQFLTLSEDGAAMERITEARAEKLAGLHQLVNKLAERRTLEENIVPNLDNSDPNDKILYANGVPLLLAAGNQDATKTVVYIDKGTIGQFDEGTDEIIYPDGNGITYDGTIAGNDLSKVAIFGGSPNQTVASTNITMTGGKVSSIYGGGYAKTTGAKANVTDSTNVKISGGTVRFYVQAGGQAAISNSTAEVGGNTKLEITGGEIGSWVHGGGIATNGNSSAAVGGNITVSISGNAVLSDDVFGGGYANNENSVSNVKSDVTGAATVTISGNAEVQGNVYQSGHLFGFDEYNDVSDSRNNSATVGEDSSITVGGGAKIGGARYGIVINGGTGPVTTGVESFVIGEALTASVNVHLPAGYDITTNPTIATGAVEGDLAKITLVGSGAEGKEAYFESNGIKVRAKSSEAVPTPTVNNTSIYANGAPLLLAAGSSDPSKTVVYIDKGTIGQLDEGTDEIFDPDGSEATYDGTAAGNDLSQWFIYGGGLNQDVTSTQITMTGGKIYSIYGGGEGLASGGSANVTGNTSVKISGGVVSSPIFAGGMAYENASANVTGNAKLEITSGEIGGGVSGGGFASYHNSSATVGGSSTVAISGTAVIKSRVFGGGYANSYSASNVNANVTGAATVTISGNAEVQGSVYPSGRLFDSNNNFAVHSVKNGNSATVGDGSSVNVGGGAKIGGSTKGIVINGGSPTEFKTGVASFVIDPDLTGADGSVNVVLPAGYDVSSNPTIATGAVEADLAKIKLVGGGAEGKEAYFENNAIKVKAKSTDATLSALTYKVGSDGQATNVPGFASGTEAYNVELPFGTSATASITLSGNQPPGPPSRRTTV